MAWIIYDDNNGCVDLVDYIYPVYLMAVGKSIFDWKMQMQKICFCCNSTTWLVGILGSGVRDFVLGMVEDRFPLAVAE